MLQSATTEPGRNTTYGFLSNIPVEVVPVKHQFGMGDTLDLGSCTPNCLSQCSFNRMATKSLPPCSSFNSVAADFVGVVLAQNDL